MRTLFDDQPDDGPDPAPPPAPASPKVKPVTAFTDGGARGNPGPAGYGVHIVSPTGKTLAELSKFLGIQTNNIAEYSALVAALDWALANGVRHLRVVSDSELMVRQMQGRYKVSSPTLKPLYDEARRRVRQLEVFRIEHVLRGKNKRADALANAAMDSYSTPRAIKSGDF
jgi:probable phosphoglycerate mutase